MITHLQETWKIPKRVTYSSTIYYNYFLSRLIKIFSCSFNTILSKINRLNIQKSKKNTVDLKRTMNQFNIIFYNFHTIVGYKFYSNCHRL